MASRIDFREAILAMEALGAVSSIFAIYNQLEECGKRLHRLKHDFRIAKQEVNLLADEVSACQSLFGIFSHISRPLENRVMELARKQKLEDALNSQATFAFGQISGIVLKLEPLRKQSNASQIDQFIAKLRWHWTKDEVQLPLLTLNSVKISLTAFNCLLILDFCIADMKRPSVSKTEMKSLKMQIKHLKRTVIRQERCLRRLSTKMSDFIDTSSQPKLVVNTRLILVTINDIKQYPFAEAESLIQENILNSPVHTPTSSRKEETPKTSRMSFSQFLPGTPTDVSGSFNKVQSLYKDESCSEAGALVQRKTVRETRAVFHDYGDGNREIYETGSSVCPNSPTNLSGLYKTAFVPVPPFSFSDLRLRKEAK